MATSPPPERESKQRETGSRLLLISAVLAVIGAVVAIPLEGTAAGIGSRSSSSPACRWSPGSR